MATSVTKILFEVMQVDFLKVPEGRTTAVLSCGILLIRFANVTCASDSS